MTLHLSLTHTDPHKLENEALCLCRSCQSTSNCRVTLRLCKCLSYLPQLSFLQVISFIYADICLVTHSPKHFSNPSQSHITCIFKKHIIYSVIQDISKHSEFQKGAHGTLFDLFFCSDRISLASLRRVFWLCMSAVGNLIYIRIL